jgi:hypothetical protein
MSANKTAASESSPERFLALLPEAKRADALRLDALFREVTGWSPVMWGPSILGYGRYHYRYDSGREGDFLATGFAPRAHGFSVYIMPGYQDFGPILARIGRHRMGRSCLEIRRLSEIDEAVLGELIRAGLDKLGQRWAIEPS